MASHPDIKPSEGCPPPDPGQVPVYSPTGGVKDDNFAGLGMFLIRSLVDDCLFVNRGPAGKEIVLIKYLQEGEDPPVDAPQPRRNVALHLTLKWHRCPRINQKTGD